MKTKTNSAKGVQKGIPKKEHQYAGFDSALMNLGIKIIPFTSDTKVFLK